MWIPMIDSNISTMDSEELKWIEDKNKNFLYSTAIHANHMIQHHMHEISEHKQVVDKYRSMDGRGREMIPLESDQYKNDLAVNQHEMDDKTHTKRTTNTGNQLNITTDDLQLGVDSDTSTLATQETSVKNVVYITNIPEGKLDHTKDI